MIALRSANHQSFRFWKGVSRGHASEFGDGAFRLGSGPPFLTFAAYGGSPLPGGIPSLAYGSDDPRADFVSLPAICSSARGGI